MQQGRGDPARHAPPRRVRQCAPALAAGLLAALATHGPALAQKIGLAPDDDVPAWRVVGALLLCLGLAAAAAFVMRRRYGGLPLLPTVVARERRLRLVETVRLSHQTDVCLLEAENELFLIAASQGGPVLLARGLGRPPAAAPE